MASACTSGIDTGFVALGYPKVAILGVVQGIKVLAAEHQGVGRVEETDLGGDGPRGLGVVAGDHLHVDAGPPASGPSPDISNQTSPSLAPS